jgi:hypothetical protein
MSIQPKPYDPQGSGSPGRRQEPGRDYSFEDYLAAERECTDAKHEYVAGRVFAMVGASFNHDLITSRYFRCRSGSDSRPVRPCGWWLSTVSARSPPPTGRCTDCPRALPFPPYRPTAGPSMPVISYSFGI